MLCEIIMFTFFVSYWMICLYIFLFISYFYTKMMDLFRYNFPCFIFDKHIFELDIDENLGKELDTFFHNMVNTNESSNCKCDYVELLTKLRTKVVDTLDKS